MSKPFRIAFAAALTSVALFAAPIGASSTTPLPKVTGPIPVTADSFPFLAADRTLRPIDLQKVGYVEEEFIVSGAANVYDWAPDGSLTVKTPDAPYATRVLVRRPKDPSRFSGQAVVELLNPARRFDWGMMSGYLRDSLIERGDAWVGITMPASAKALQKFNPTRYAALSFANPNPSEACAAGRGGAAPATSDQEDGLRWDMISQVGVALKSKTGLNASSLFMTAQGADIQTYLAAIQRHAKLASGKPVYDGFLIKTPGGVGAIRRCAPAPDKNDARQKIENEGVPVMLVVAQGEISEAYQRPDSDDPGDRFRIYEVAGAAHIDKLAYLDMPGFPDQLAAIGTPGQGTPDWPFNVRCEPEIPLQEHPLLKYILDGAVMNMELWATKGTAPPKAERITIAGDVSSGGSVSGGVRNPDVDVPAATYTTTTAGPGTCRELGRTIPYDWAHLEALYGNQKGYAAKVAQSVDKMVKEHWITDSDARKMKAGQ
jgi:Alpha/beta hydrolase domain